MATQAYELPQPLPEQSVLLPGVKLSGGEGKSVFAAEDELAGRRAIRMANAIHRHAQGSEQPLFPADDYIDPMANRLTATSWALREKSFDPGQRLEHHLG